MKENNIAQQRIKKLILQDKIRAYDGFVELLKSDIKQTLSSYMKVKNLNIDIDIKDNNNYLLDIKVECIDIISPSSCN